MSNLRQAAEQALEALQLPSLKTMSMLEQRDQAIDALRAALDQQTGPLTINEVEQILAQHDYELHGDRARYIVRMTEEAHGIKEVT